MSTPMRLTRLNSIGRRASAARYIPSRPLPRLRRGDPSGINARLPTKWGGEFQDARRRPLRQPDNQAVSRHGRCQLDLNVVRVSEGEHEDAETRERLDFAMGNALLVEEGHRLVELGAA